MKNIGSIFNTKALLFSSLFSLFSSLVSAQDIIQLGAQSCVFPDKNQIGVWVDSTNKLQANDLLHHTFLHQKDSTSYNRNHRATYWIKLRLTTKDANKRWLVELQDPRIEHLKVFKQVNNQFTELESTGHLHNFKTKAYAHKNFLFNLDLDTNVTTYLFKLKTSLKHVGHSLIIRSNEDVVSYFLQEYYYLGMYYGIMLIMAVYNLLIFIFTKKKLYLMYVFYVISCGLFSFQEDGLGFQFLWPNTPYINNISALFTPLFLMLTFVVYSREFLSIKWSTHKRFNQLLFVLIGIYILVFFLQLILEDFPRVGIFYIPPFLAIYIMGYIRFFKEGFKPARFFIVGYSMIILSFFIFLLRINGLIESNIFIVYNFNYGFIVEVVILSFALGERIQHSENEKHQANERALAASKKNEKLQKTLIKELQEKEELKDKVNKELEAKVTERTMELTEANQQLQNLTEELNTLNSQLDIDNWNLKKQINLETKARISSENVSFNDFIKYYNNQEACMKFLNKLKWGNGFVCTKCKHTNYTSGPRPYTRKCTHCKKIDSVTANTIFHGVRMPLQKAFYITYITSVKEKGMTVDKLAEILDLRRNTCWGFRKKVEEKMDSYMSTHNTDLIKNWEVLILD